MIIFSQNSIYSVLFLVLSFVSSSSVLFLLECEYISLIFILIYVGAIAVLFLFVVMMLDIKTIYLAKDFTEIISIGHLLYTDYVIQFLLSGNILLLATIGPVTLVLVRSIETAKTQVTFKQLSRTYESVLFIY